MKRANYLYTIERLGVKKTVVDTHSHPLIFLAIQKELGYDTVLLFVMEITEDECEYHLNNLKAQ